MLQKLMTTQFSNPNIVSGELFEAIEEEVTLAVENGNFIGVKT